MPGAASISAMPMTSYTTMPMAYSGLDHSQGKWFAPGEALPPGFIITAHPEGHTAPQEGHLMTDKARAGRTEMAVAHANGNHLELEEGSFKTVRRPSREVMAEADVAVAKPTPGFWESFACCASRQDENDAEGVVSPLPHDEGRLSKAEEELVERPETEVEAGAKYKGQWLGSQCHGKGVLTRPDGSSYEGYFQNGRAHGYGKFKAANGNVYEGDWYQDRAQGEGTYTHEDGSTYVGQWLQDEKSGKGMEKWADGSKYEGEFLQGSKHGQGTYTAANGKVVYEDPTRSQSALPTSVRQVSVFAALKRLPSPLPFKVENPALAEPRLHVVTLFCFRPGCLAWIAKDPQLPEANEEIEVGADEAKQSANDEATTPSRSPKGERTRRVSFAKDTKTPKPTSLKELLCIVPGESPGSSFARPQSEPTARDIAKWTQGQFSADRMDGNGTYHFSDGRVYTGAWQKGHMSGTGTMTWPDGSKYEGEYRNDFRHGHGTLTWPDGRKYKGQWNNGKQDGEGVMVDSLGNATKSRWKNGSPVEE
eukprot:s121_g5.t2